MSSKRFPVFDPDDDAPAGPAGSAGPADDGEPDGGGGLPIDPLIAGIGIVAGFVAALLWPRNWKG